MFGGPWMVGDHYVVIQDWRPYFQPEDSHISTLRVWVRLPGIPLEYFDAAILTIIGNKIGKTVRLDLTTLGGSRGNFARICVEVDLSKPLLSKYRLRRRVRRIEYEGLHTICYSCGCYGHAQDTCQKKEEDSVEAAPEVMIVNPIFQKENDDAIRPEVEEDFGPWMKVSRANRRGKKPSQKMSDPAADPPSVSSPATIPRNGSGSISGNKFNALTIEESEDVDDGKRDPEADLPNQGSDERNIERDGAVQIKVVRDLMMADKENKEVNVQPPFLCEDLMQVDVASSADSAREEALAHSVMVGPSLSDPKSLSASSKAKPGNGAKPNISGGISKPSSGKSSGVLGRQSSGGFPRNKGVAKVSKVNEFSDLLKKAFNAKPASDSIPLSNLVSGQVDEDLPAGKGVIESPLK
ncbi:hypothetical protein LINPERHAP2_LOCUS16600 [Linum perenne]